MSKRAELKAYWTLQTASEARATFEQFGKEPARSRKCAIAVLPDGRLDVRVGLKVRKRHRHEVEREVGVDGDWRSFEFSAAEWAAFASRAVFVRDHTKRQGERTDLQHRGD